MGSRSAGRKRELGQVTGSESDAQRRGFLLDGELEEAREADVEPFAIWSIGAAARDGKGSLVKSLQQVEHRAVLVLEQPPRDVHDVVGRDADEVLVECSVVDRAQTQPVLDCRLTRLENVAQDVGCVEQAQFLQPADSALAVVCGDDSAAETGLM